MARLEKDEMEALLRRFIASCGSVGLGLTLAAQGGQVRHSLVRQLIIKLGGGFKYFLFSSLLGEMMKFDEHIFQMG